MNALRRELNTLLIPEEGGRKPAIRRSLDEDWLYATDLPSFAPQERTETVRRSLAEAGWESAAAEGWLRLRRPVREPPEDFLPGNRGKEAACCRSLLMRHPEREKPMNPGSTESACRAAYLLIRAAEEGPESYEAACGRLHREWAERLRKKKELPDISPLFFEDPSEEQSEA